MKDYLLIQKQIHYIKKTKVEFEPNSEFIIPKTIVETDGNEKQTDLTIMEFILNAYGISGDKALSIAAKILAANENINENTIITNEILNELNFTFKVTWEGEIVENK